MGKQPGRVEKSSALNRAKRMWAFIKGVGAAWRWITTVGIPPVALRVYTQVTETMGSWVWIASASWVAVGSIRSRVNPAPMRAAPSWSGLPPRVTMAPPSRRSTPRGFCRLDSLATRASAGWRMGAFWPSGGQGDSDGGRAFSRSLLSGSPLVPGSAKGRSPTHFLRPHDRSCLAPPLRTCHPLRADGVATSRSHLQPCQLDLDDSFPRKK